MLHKVREIVHRGHAIVRKVDSFKMYIHFLKDSLLVYFTLFVGTNRGKTVVSGFFFVGFLLANFSQDENFKVALCLRSLFSSLN